MRRSTVRESVPATHYVKALQKNEYEDANFGLRSNGNGKIQHVRMRSKQLLSWQIGLTDFSGKLTRICTFSVEEGFPRQVDGVDYFYYVKDVNWAVPEEGPIDRTITVALRNLSTVAKTAGSAGEVKISLDIDQ